ncbi:hypothetical protein H8M03_05895 [Sphingomonas sabuli]|uniref:Uncharacterized protein n=1 Tax=Sphingomonas sabuli TaxID=2764186 RepID=A0A7G9L5F0_9SPHN|nr:hypothetical protein [Sphingomonas sabuli]QNM83849.1 hypothetical protein H8M03_05895 [Sphingomonas sabuli]
MIVAAIAMAAASPANGTIAGVEARLFYNETGQLSPDVLGADRRFVGWNTIIGEGDAGGSADDVMILVALAARKSDGVAATLDTPLTIVAEAKGKTIAKRTFDNVILPYTGVTYSALYLSDVACAGTIKVTVRLGAEVRDATLQMDCGE